MPKTKPQTRRSYATPTGRRALPEPQPSTRLAQIKGALQNIDFGFTIFFASERGESIKYYQGAIRQDEAQN